MKKISFLFIIVLFGLSLIGCKKSNNNVTADSASKSSGIYTGWTFLSTSDSVGATTVVTKLSASTVSLSINIMNVKTSFTPVTVSDGDNGKILLTQSINSLNGTASGKSLVYYINGVKYFTGSKP
jgi:hypothetical protein